MVRIDQQGFLDRCWAKFGKERYDFSMSVYVASKKEVQVKCNQCLVIFSKRPDLLWAGSGCQNCSIRASQLPMEVFLQRSKEKHGDKYDYGKVILNGVDRHVIIFCKGCQRDFKQTPYDHMKGHGHKLCSNNMSKEEFLRRVKEIHGNDYDFSKVNYISTNQRIKVKCNGCGEISNKMARSFLSEHKCKNCYHKRQRKTTETFIKQAKEKHGDKFDYSKTVYTLNNIPLTIGCRECGKDFDQFPNGHLTGSGCPTCAWKGMMKTQEEFITKIEQYYPNKYDFSKCVYNGTYNSVILIEKETGKEVKKVAKLFFNGRCYKCSNYAYYKDKNGYLCPDHKTPDAVKLNKVCINEGCETSANSKYDKYCAYCFCHLFPDHEKSRNFKTKEKEVVNHVRECFSKQVDIVTDKTIDGGCSKRRPDILIDMGGYAIVIEVDENQHGRYDTTCDNKRYCEIAMDLGDGEVIKPVVFIRFNPDSFKKDGKLVRSCWKNHHTGISISDKPQWQTRLKELDKTIQYWIDNSPEKEFTHEWLFFNEDDDIEEANDTQISIPQLGYTMIPKFHALISKKFKIDIEKLDNSFKEYMMEQFIPKFHTFISKKFKIDIVKLTNAYDEYKTK
jgi:hypothetical protein